MCCSDHVLMLHLATCRKNRSLRKASAKWCILYNTCKSEQEIGKCKSVQLGRFFFDKKHLAEVTKVILLDSTLKG